MSKVLPKIGIVIPCYNEENRINVNSYHYFFENNDIFILFVNYGNTDKTTEIINSITLNNPNAGLIVKIIKVKLMQYVVLWN